jgi:hypothetical protein
MISSKWNDIIKIDERKFGIDTERQRTQQTRAAAVRLATLGWVNCFSITCRSTSIFPGIFQDQFILSRSWPTSDLYYSNNNHSRSHEELRFCCRIATKSLLVQWESQVTKNRQTTSVFLLFVMNGAWYRSVQGMTESLAEAKLMAISIIRMIWCPFRRFDEIISFWYFVPGFRGNLFYRPIENTGLTYCHLYFAPFTPASIGCPHSEDDKTSKFTHQKHRLLSINSTKLRENGKSDKMAAKYHSP